MRLRPLLRFGSKNREENCRKTSKSHRRRGFSPSNPLSKVEEENKIQLRVEPYPAKMVWLHPIPPLGANCVNSPMNTSSSPANTSYTPGQHPLQPHQHSVCIPSEFRDCDENCQRNFCCHRHRKTYTVSQKKEPNILANISGNNGPTVIKFCTHVVHMIKNMCVKF